MGTKGSPEFRLMRFTKYQNDLLPLGLPKAIVLLTLSHSLGNHVPRFQVLGFSIEFGIQEVKKKRTMRYYVVYH